MNQKFRKELLPSILLSVATAFMLFIFAPLEIYFNNVYEFWFDFYMLFPVCLFMFAIFFIVSTVIFGVLYKISVSAYRFGIILYLTGFCCTYIQGNFLAGNLPLVDGSVIDWSKYGIQRISCILLWIIVCVLVVAAMKVFSIEKLVRAAGVISGFITLILLITLITVGSINRGFTRKLSIGNSSNYALEMSNNQNFVMLLLDTIDGDSMTGLLEEHPEYADSLSDFTYYCNTMGSYPYTIYSVPYIFSGEWYENQEDFMEYGKRVYRESPLFEELEKKGYRMGLYEPEAFRLEESMLRFENMVNYIGDISSYPAFIKLEMKLIGFKYMPYDLKRFCVTIPAEFEGLRAMDKDAYGEAYSSYNRDFYSYLQDHQVTLTDDKCFRFFHLEGAHQPWIYDADLNEVDGATYKQAVEASFKIVTTYLQKLKDSGVYDNTAIIILSDHGCNVLDPDNKEGRQQPILFVKGVGEQHATMQISAAPISQADFMEAYKRLLDGKTGNEVFDYQEGDYRERRYLLHDSADSYLIEYLQTGYAGDEDTMIPTGKESIPRE